MLTCCCLCLRKGSNLFQTPRHSHKRQLPNHHDLGASDCFYKKALKTPIQRCSLLGVSQFFHYFRLSHEHLGSQPFSPVHPSPFRHQLQRFIRPYWCFGRVCTLHWSPLLCCHGVSQGWSRSLLCLLCARGGNPHQILFSRTHGSGGLRSWGNARAKERSGCSKIMGKESSSRVSCVSVGSVIILEKCRRLIFQKLRAEIWFAPWFPK